MFKTMLGLQRFVSVQTIRMVIEVDHFEYGAPHARISVVLVIFQWDRLLVVLTTYVQC